MTLPIAMTTAPHVLAVDFGGTRLRVARAAADGTLLANARVPTPSSGDPAAVVDTIARLARELAVVDEGDVIGVGVAAPGPLDPKTGVVLATPNLVGWEDFPLAARLAERLGQPVWVHNDANLAAFGEARRGAGVGYDPLVYLTLSTGVGGGLIVGGRMFEGATGLAGELGHVIVRAGDRACNFGHSGCLEGLASGTAIARDAAAALANGQTSRILDFVAAGEALTARTVAQAADVGDPVACALFDALGTVLGLAIGGFINVLDPARVVIGGGVSGAWPHFEPAMLRAVASVAMCWSRRPIDIVPAALGDDAGLVGAALYAVERTQLAD